MTSNELEIFKQSILDDIRVMMQTAGQVTQYIGARYVPLFADPIEWDDQREYEPLTVVLHQGNSYTTRQFTPKGIDISNETFWAETGNYNAQIEQYRKEVAAFDARITAAQNTADSKAPINHATDSTEYGIGNSLNYGHVKLADDDTPELSGANDGVAATPKMLNESVINDVAFTKCETIGISVNNSESNNSTAIESAFSNGILNIKFNSGIYKFERPIKLPNGSFLLGNGSGTVLKFTDCNGIDVTNNGNTASGVNISNLSIFGNYTMGTYADYNMQSMTKGLIVNARGCHFENLYIREFATGIASSKPSNLPTYNERTLRNANYYGFIHVTDCFVGIESRDYDPEYIMLDIGRCPDGIKAIANVKITSGHIWGFFRGLLAFDNCQISNVEFEYPGVQDYPDMDRTNIFYVDVENGNLLMDNVSFRHQTKDAKNTIYGIYLAQSASVVANNIMVGDCATDNSEKDMGNLLYMNSNSIALIKNLLIKSNVLAGNLDTTNTGTIYIDGFSKSPAFAGSNILKHDDGRFYVPTYTKQA